MRSIEPQARRVAALAALAAVVLVLPGAGLTAGVAKQRVGVLTDIVKSKLFINGKRVFAGNVALHPRDVLTLDPNGKVRFSVVQQGVEVDCTFWSKPVAGSVEVQPQTGVGLAFNAGTTLCATPHAARHTWQSWVNGKAARLEFHDPLFTVVVGKGSGVVRVRRGTLVVAGKSGKQGAVVVGRNQQVVVGRNTDPSQPMATTTIPGPESTVLHQVEGKLPPLKDVTPPTTSFTQTPHDPSSIRSAAFAFQAEAGSTFSCSLDDEPFHLCTSPAHFDGPLAPGKHSFAVRATDAAGNVEPKPALFTWNVDSSRIVFESTRSGNADIYVMDPVADPTGKNAVDLTNDPAGDHDPVWSPDRSRIAFHSDRLGGINNIWLMDAKGGSLVQLTHDRVGATNPTWSPDGKLLAYERSTGGQREIWVTNPDPLAKQIQLTSSPGAGADANFDPAWSPKGDQIAFASTRDGNYEIYVMNADGSNQRRLTNDSAVEFNPAWSPDGSRIAFHSDVNRTSKQIWVMSATGADAHAVVVTQNEDANPTWAPDGFELAFQTGSGDTDIAIVGLDGKGFKQLTFAPGLDGVPDWR